jgi:phage shock protein E
MKTIIIDVRETQEYNEGHVPEALHIPPSELMAGAKELKDVPKDAKIIVYCRTGSRSNVAKHILSDLGYSDITNGINKEQVQAKYNL